MGKNFPSSENSSEDLEEQESSYEPSHHQSANGLESAFAPPANADGTTKKISTPVLVAMVIGFAALAIVFNYTFLKASRQMQSLVPTSKPLVTRMSVDKLRSDHDAPKPKPKTESKKP